MGRLRKRLLVISCIAAVVALGVMSGGTTMGFFSATETQASNVLSGATFSPSAAPVPAAVNETPESNSVALSWSPVTLSDTSLRGSVEYTVLRSDGNIVCALVSATSCTDTTGTGGTDYTYTEEAFYVVDGTPTWSLGPSLASNEVVFPETPSFTTTLVQPTSSTVGNTWSDDATLTGDTNGGAPFGTVSFYFCEEATPPSSPCSTGGSLVGTVTSPSTAGAVASYTPATDSETPTVGTYCYYASYSASPSGGPYSSVALQTDTECFTVNAAAPSSFTTALAQPTSTTLGNSWNDAATVTGNGTGGAPTGSVTFTFCPETSGPCTGGTTIATVSTATSTGDSSTFSLPSADAEMPAAVGTYCYNAAYSATAGGNYSSVAQQSDTECFTATQATPSNVVTNNPTSPTLGQTVTFTATVSGPPGVEQPTGIVSWSVSGTAGASSSATSTTTLSGGAATCTVTVSNAGTYVVSDTYGGDGNYTQATSSADSVSIAKATPTDVVTNSPTLPTLGQSVTFTATVSGPAGATAPSGGTLTWTVSGPGGISSCTTSSTTSLDGSSQATCVLTVTAAGTYQVADSWGGNANYNSATSTADSVSVSKVSPTETVTNNEVPSGGPLVFTATVSGPLGGAPPSGSMGWTITPPSGPGSCSSTTGPTGSANVATYTCTINSPLAGSYSATASYPGDSNYSNTSASDTTSIPSASAPSLSASVTFTSGSVTWVNSETVTLGDSPSSGVSALTYYYCSTASCTASSGVEIGASSAGSPWTVHWLPANFPAADGTYYVVAVATGTNGNESGPSAATEIGIDRTAPSVSQPFVNGFQ